MTVVSQTDLVAGAIAGKAVSFPTDTVPALAVRPQFAATIFKLKQRPDNKPLILLGASFDDLLPYIAGNPAELSNWQNIMAKYLPGAVTFVLPASDKVPPGLNRTDAKTIGIRIPANDTALSILKETGALATSSANISGEDVLTSAIAIDRVFADVLVLESTTMGSGLPSTVVKWENSTWKILRQGSITIQPLDYNS